MPYAIDTHAAIRELEASGFQTAQAEALISVVARTEAERFAGLATKADVTAVRTNLKDFATKDDLKTEIAAVRADLKDFATKDELKAEITGLRDGVRTDFASVRNEIASVRNEVASVRNEVASLRDEQKNFVTKDYFHVSLSDELKGLGIRLMIFIVAVAALAVTISEIIP